MFDYQNIAIDNGSSMTKMGYSGNETPELIIPTAISNIKEEKNMYSEIKNLHFYNFNNYYIGDKAIANRNSKIHVLEYPLINGVIENFELMEKFWEQSIYHYLRCDPSNHCFFLTDPPFNGPKERQICAEIFFETFGVLGLFMADSSLFSYYASTQYDFEDNYRNNGTCVLVESGENITQIITYCEDFSFNKKSYFPINGKKITQYIKKMLNERNEKIYKCDLNYAAKYIKEKYCYTANDLPEEFHKLGNKEYNLGEYMQNNNFKKFEGIGAISNIPFSINLGYEQFLGPELYFSPNMDIENCECRPIDEIIDLSILNNHNEYYKELYSNIILTGGSTRFKNFNNRLEIQLKKRIEKRLGKNNGIDVKVHNLNSSQKDLVWLGESILASNDNTSIVSRNDYDELGINCFIEKVM